MRREGTKISYARADPEVCLLTLEALYHGIVLANEVELARLYPGFQGLRERGVVYEKPQPVSTRDQDQHVGTISYVLMKGRATCIEVAAAVAAMAREDGYEGATVRLEPVHDVYGQPIPYSYHAVADIPGFGVVDPSEDLPGYSRVPTGGEL